MNASPLAPVQFQQPIRVAFATLTADIADSLQVPLDAPDEQVHSMLVAIETLRAVAGVGITEQGSVQGWLDALGPDPTGMIARKLGEPFALVCARALGGIEAAEEVMVCEFLATLLREYDEVMDLAQLAA